MKTNKCRLGPSGSRFCHFLSSDCLFLVGPFLLLLVLTTTLDVGTASFIMVDLSQYVTTSRVDSDHHQRLDPSSSSRRRSARRKNTGTNQKKGAVAPLSLLVPSQVTQLLPQQQHDTRLSLIKNPTVLPIASVSSIMGDQSKNRKSPAPAQKTGHPAMKGRGFLVPSQVLRAHVDSIQHNNDKASTTTPPPLTKVVPMVDSSSLTNDNNNGNSSKNIDSMDQLPPMTGRAKRRKRRTGQRPNNATMISGANAATRMGPPKIDRDSTMKQGRDWTGNLPDIEWCVRASCGVCVTFPSADYGSNNDTND
jgi:hypothetical protein